MAKKRRKLSAKQRAALAKGRKAMAAKRRSKKRSTSERRKLGYVRDTKKRRKTVAKKRKSTRRRSAPRRRRRSTGGGGGRGLMAGIEWKDMAGAAALGWAAKQYNEKKEESLLAKVPLFYEGIGVEGCTAVLAHLVGRMAGGTAGRVARHLAKGAFDVAAYKLAKRGSLYASKDEAYAALAGDDDMGWSEPDEVGIELEGDDLEGDDDLAGDDDLVGDAFEDAA